MRFFTPPPSKPLISLTPLIDVVFILLIFFMLASSFMDWRTIEMTVSTASMGAAKSDKKPMVVETYEDGQVAFGGQKISVNDLIEHLKADKSDRPILLKPVENISLQASVRILEKLTKNGVSGVTFFTPAAKE